MSEIESEDCVRSPSEQRQDEVAGDVENSIGEQSLAPQLDLTTCPAFRYASQSSRPLGRTSPDKHHFSAFRVSLQYLYLHGGPAWRLVRPDRKVTDRFNIAESACYMDCSEGRTFLVKKLNRLCGRYSLHQD